MDFSIFHPENFPKSGFSVKNHPGKRRGDLWKFFIGEKLTAEKSSKMIINWRKLLFWRKIGVPQDSLGLRTLDSIHMHYFWWRSFWHRRRRDYCSLFRVILWFRIFSLYIIYISKYIFFYYTILRLPNPVVARLCIICVSIHLYPAPQRYIFFTFFIIHDIHLYVNIHYIYQLVYISIILYCDYQAKW